MPSILVDQGNSSSLLSSRAIPLLKGTVGMIPITLLQAIIVLMVFNDMQSGRTSLLSAVREALPTLPKAIVIGLLSGIAVFIGNELLVIPGILAEFWLFLVIPIAVVEKDLSLGGVFKRSRTLVRGYFWPIVGITVVTMVPFMIAGIIGELYTGGIVFGTPSHIKLGWPILIFSVLNSLFFSIAVAFVYLRLANSNESIIEPTGITAT
jgi:cation transporter-like permease